jgi:alpha-D-xyloside xylohydrolase
VQRATFVEFPDDRTTYFLDQQYCLGPSLLVAPIFAKSDVEVEWYLPAGRWISFWDAKDVVDGPVWIRRKQNYDEIPVFVREGSVLCLGKSGIGRPDYDYTHDLEIRVYTLKDGRASDAVIPTGKGTGRAAVVKASKSGGELRVVIEDGKLTGDWKVTLVGICESAKDEHGNVVHAKGGSLTVEAGKGSSSVHLTNLK